MTMTLKRRLEVAELGDSERRSKSLKSGSSSRTRKQNVADFSPVPGASAKKQTYLNFITISSSSDDDGGVGVTKEKETEVHIENGTVQPSVPNSKNENNTEDAVRHGSVVVCGNPPIHKNFRVEIPRRATPVLPKQQNTAQHVPKAVTPSVRKVTQDSRTSYKNSALRATSSLAKQSKKDTKGHRGTTSTPSMKNGPVSLRVLPKRASSSSTAAQLRYMLSSEDDSENSANYAESRNTTQGTGSDDFSTPDTESTADNHDSSSLESEDSSADQMEPKKQDKRKRQSGGALARQSVSDSSSDLVVSSDERTLTERPKPVQKLPDSWAYKEGIASDQAPLHDISDIFADMAEKAVELGFKKVSDHLRGRRLRVATMCSGTESPILCLNEICRVLNTRLGIEFEFEHMFSAEIVPFKQAYIERNFRPPILFRDIRQLANMDKAETAYGAPTAVPSEVDLIVAGFSCVDYSMLNRHPKSLDEIGESRDTLRAIVSYADKYRTPLFVLENVCLAPWLEIQKMWASIEYEALVVKVDTKKYYIPHTRQRGYIICIDQRNKEGFSPKSAVKEWTELIKKFERPASSPVNEFLLHPDDPRLHRATEEMTKGAPGEEKVARDVDWSRCQGRHHYYRDFNNLGTLRPITEWIENSSSRMLDFGNRPWMTNQVDRVKDTVEVSWLRNARRGYDTAYKTRVLDLSQNVDRNVDTTPFGLTGCITPSGQPFLSTRGGPIVGLESLMLQGLPIDRLHLTRETQANLQDMAGNAMTSTVVGAAILSALIAGYQALSKATGGGMVTESVIILPSREINDVSLRTETIDFGSPGKVSVANLQSMAKNSAQRCQCEGQFGKATTRLMVCKACSHTVCEKCGGIPRHEYTGQDSNEVQSRIETHVFMDIVKKALPMRLHLVGLDKHAFEKAKVLFQDIVIEDDWRHYVNTVLPVLKPELRFHSIKRGQFWTVKYEAPRARMELIFGTNKPEWFLYVKPDPLEPGISKIRKLLEQPVARMVVKTNDLLKGTWELRIPTRLEFLITIEGTTNLVPSWNSRLGLAEYRDQKVWSELRIDVLDNQIAQRYNVDIAGIYKLLPNCGTASGALHRRISKSHQKHLYLFLDPGHIANPIDDHFVISTDIRRLTPGEVRHIDVRLDRIRKNGKESRNWRQSAETNPQQVKCSILEQWTEFDATLKPILGPSATYAVPTEDFAVSIESGNTKADIANKTVRQSNCDLALRNILSCRVPLAKDENLGWRADTWTAVDKVNEREQFESLAWLTERIRGLHGFSDRWRSLKLSGRHTKCQGCSPDRPEIKWKLEYAKTVKYIPYEDMAQAGPYERAVKARPAPFVTQVQSDSSQNGRLVLGLNVTTLAHRALGRFEGLETYNETAVSWRLVTNHVQQITSSFPKFALPHNKNDPCTKHIFPGKNVDGSQLSLRFEQQRSLHWMIEQEARHPQPFLEQEIEEACLSSMSWRAEVRATRACYVRGGVLADKVGYGKTITTLALIDSQRRKELEQSTEVNTKIPFGSIQSKATLILVPGTIVPQWEQQARKFLGKKYSVLVIKNASSLDGYKVSQFKATDIIIAPWSIFDSDSYLRKLSRFGALPEAPPTAQGRAFAAWRARIIENVGRHTEELKSSPFPVNFAKSLRERLSVAENDENLLARVPSKRLKGKQYVADVNGSLKSKARNPLKLSKAAELKASNSDYSGLTKANSLDDIQGPLFEMFTFNRLVVDEYTYISAKQSASINSLKASSRWALSGTPALGDFADVKSLAAFVGIHLGVDDAYKPYLKTTNLKAMTKDRTAVEQFQSYDQAYSPAWYEHRHRHAQEFLNQFVRQNTAEIDDIPLTERLKGVILPASERAAYLELQMQLCAQDMKIRKGNSSKLDNDRTRRLNELLDDSNSPEEALLRRCSTSVSDQSSITSDSCEPIVAIRQGQLDDLRHELERNLRNAALLNRQYGAKDDHYDRWRKSVRNGNYGDAIATEHLKTMIEKAESKSHSKSISGDSSALALRNLAEHLHILAREFVNRMRALRFLHNMRKFQTQQSNISTASKNSLADCPHEVHDPDDVSILGLCGHVVCRLCVSSPDRGKQCAVKYCNAAAMDYHIIPIAELGQDNMKITSKCHHGGKIEDIINLIKHKIPPEDQVLLFVQFDDLMNKIAAALDKHEIPKKAITEKDASGTKGGTMMANFQEETSAKKYKVLLLISGHESSAGVNLTNANHIIFASPILAQSQDEYDALDEQCVGRARRFGQTKMVYLYRFLSLKTIDVDILQKRSEKKLVKEHEGDYILKAHNDLTVKDRSVDLGSRMGETLFLDDLVDD